LLLLSVYAGIDKVKITGLSKIVDNDAHERLLLIPANSPKHGIDAQERPPNPTLVVRCKHRPGPPSKVDLDDACILHGGLYTTHLD
jgi:hypothetical protein